METTSNPQNGAVDPDEEQADVSRSLCVGDWLGLRKIIG